MPEIFAIASCSSRSIRADYISDRPIPSLQYWWGVQTNLGESPTRYSRGAVCHCFRLETPRIDWIQITYFLFDANESVCFACLVDELEADAKASNVSERQWFAA